VPHRKRCLVGFLLAAGLLIAPAAGQDRPAPAGWAPTGEPVPPDARSETPAPPSPSVRTVIATSRPVAPTSVNVKPFAVPDDAIGRTGTAKPPPPDPVAFGREETPHVQQASFHTDTKTDPAVVSVGGPATTTTPARASAVCLEVVGPEQVSPGETLPYEIVVTNPGPVLLAHMRVEDRLPDGAKLRSAEPAPDVQGDRLVWDLGNLEGHGRRRLRVEIQPGGQEEMAFTPTATFTAALGLRTRLAQPTFSVTQTAPDVVMRGATVPFQIQVANHGTTALTHVVVRDELPPGLEHPQGSKIQADIGTLAPGQTRTLRLDVIASRAGRVVNEVTAQANGTKEVQSRTAVQVAEATLALKIDGPARTPFGQDVDLRLEVANPGPGTATNVRLTQMVPDGFDLLGASTGGAADSATRSVAWFLGTLTAGQRQVVALKVRSKMAGDWKWPAMLTADRMAETEAVHAMTVEGAAALALDVVTRDAAVDVGGEATVEVHVSNHGTAADSTVRLKVQVTEGLLLTRADGPTNGQQGQQVVVFDPLPSLAAKGDAVFRVRVRGERPGAGGVSAEVTAVNLKQPLRRDVNLTVRAATAGRRGE
jgi:uncharacterized repeat protein (TIGR01451 family)